MDPHPSPHEFDSVKAEKAEAMLRYRWNRNLKTLARALELLVALLLVSWYSGLSAAAGDFLLRLAGLLTRPLVVFLISNGIIGMILFSAWKSDDRRHPHEPSHIYDEYLSARRASGGGSYPDTVAAPDEVHEDKQIVPYEAFPAHEKIITEVPLPAPEPDPLPLTVGPAVEKGAGEEDVAPGAVPLAAAAAAAERRYRRTRSEVTAGEGEEWPRAELRRWATDNGRPRPSRGAGEEERRPPSPSPSVGDLSDEEFNLTVENFIAKTKCFLREEIMAEE